jgi:hypothetical protein
MAALNWQINLVILNLGYGKTTQKLFCGTEALNYPGS